LVSGNINIEKSSKGNFLLIESPDHRNWIKCRLVTKIDTFFKRIFSFQNPFKNKMYLIISSVDSPDTQIEYLARKEHNNIHIYENLLALKTFKNIPIQFDYSSFRKSQICGKF